MSFIHVCQLNTFLQALLVFIYMERLFFPSALIPRELSTIVSICNLSYFHTTAKHTFHVYTGTSPHSAKSDMEIKEFLKLCDRDLRRKIKVI